MIYPTIARTRICSRLLHDLYFCASLFYTSSPWILTGIYQEEALLDLLMGPSQAVQDQSGERLLPRYSVSADRNASSDSILNGSASHFIIEDSCEASGYSSRSTLIRVWSVVSGLQTWLTQYMGDGAASGRPCVHCDKGENRTEKWLRRFIIIGIGWLIFL